jgi:uncharacterized RDD family membrane protein YckC
LFCGLQSKIKPIYCQFIKKKNRYLGIVHCFFVRFTSMSTKLHYIPTYINIPLEFEIANVGKRALAFLIDMFIKSVYFFAMLASFGGNEYLLYVTQIPLLLYSFLFEWLNKGQTPGKWLMRIQVISIEGNLPSVYQCATRWLFNLVDVWSLMLFSFLNPLFATFGVFSPFFGFLLIVFTPKNQRFGDMAANTVVINIKEQQVSLKDTVIAYADYSQNYEPQFPEVMRLSDGDLNKIKYYAETAGHDDVEIIKLLATRIKELLTIQTDLNDFKFLNQLLTDYNYYAKEA